MLLRHYFEKPLPQHELAALLGDWMDVLAPCSQAAIEWACLAYMREEPSRRPTPGAIYRRCLALLAEKSKRRLRAFPVPDEPEPVPPSAERVRL